MIEIKTYPIDDNELKNHLQRIGDLMNVEGPMLSLFKDKRTDELYLFDWVDNDETYNRWLVYRISINTLSLFINKGISYRNMLDTFKEYYVTDIKGQQNPPFEILKIEKLPTEYYPGTDTFFDEGDAKNFDKINSVLRDLIKKRKRQQMSSTEPFKNVIIGINDIKKDRFLESQVFTVNIYSIIENTEVNDVTEKISGSNLFLKNDNEFSRLLQKTELDLQYR